MKPFPSETHHDTMFVPGGKKTGPPVVEGGNDRIWRFAGNVWSPQ